MKRNISARLDAAIEALEQAARQTGDFKAQSKTLFGARDAVIEAYRRDKEDVRLATQNKTLLSAVAWCGLGVACVAAAFTGVLALPAAAVWGGAAACMAAAYAHGGVGQFLFARRTARLTAKLDEADLRATTVLTQLSQSADNLSAELCHDFNRKFIAGGQAVELARTPSRMRDICPAG